MKIISEKNLEKAKNIIRNLNEKPVVVLAQNLEYNRKMLEWGKFDVLLDLEFSSDIGKDKLKQVNSGFNHVLAKIAAKNRIAIGISLDSVRDLENKKKAIVLEKLIQNIKFCRKAGTKIILFNYKDDKDAIAFLLSLGSDTKQAKESLNKTFHWF